MIINNTNILNKNFDYTIVGSGPASLALALKLEEKGFSVLIFEAGGLYPEEDSQKIYEGENIGDEYFDLDITRLRCFGGSSQHWGGWCRTLDDIDFKEWPIKKFSLDKYLENACEILEIQKNFYEKKINENLNQISFNFSPPVRFNEKYYEKIKKSKKIFLILNTPLLNIIGNDYGNVEYISFNNLGVNKKIKIENLILGCGGIENSRILLWSKQISKNNFLKNIYPGYYWMEHPHYEVGNFVGISSSLKKLINTEYSKDNYFFLSFNDRFIKENNIRNNAIRFQYQASRKFAEQLIYDLNCYGSNFSKKITKLFNENQACFYKIKMVWEQKPNLSSKIVLSQNNKDRFDIPKVNLNWKKTPDDLSTPKKCLQKLGEFFIEQDIGRIGIYDFVQNKKAFPTDDEVGGHHHMGGTRMGDGNDKYDVVDENLKVFGTQNLYVVGSSVFRTGGHANPTLTIVQLSLRLADYLSKIN